jgi:geranylgeranyl reductase family protein
MVKSDVCVLGAGPSGTTATLFLAKYGIECLLVDKAKFPRDKICGDGISGWVLTILKEFDPQVLQKFSKQPFLLPSYGIRIVAPNFKKLDIPFFSSDPQDPYPPGYTGRRIDLDNFLFEEVKSRREVTILEDTEITGYRRVENGFILFSGNGDVAQAKIIIFANGANSIFAKDPGHIEKSKKNTMTGIKVYYDGVTGFHEQNYVELHFLKEILPGYFWIFPLKGGLANVGIGLTQDMISTKKINLKETMLHAIQSVPGLKERFKNAKQVTKIQAHSLPMWDRRRTISGDHFMLAGDAASLIDPVTGEGIGHAVISGMYAANQAKRSLEAENFSAGFMAQYEADLYARIGKELSISGKIPKFIRYPWLFNTMVNKALKSQTLQRRLSEAMTDLEVRKKLNHPSLYLKVMLGL